MTDLMCRESGWAEITWLEGLQVYYNTKPMQAVWNTITASATETYISQSSTQNCEFNASRGEAW